ncbi:MAG TPA: adenylate/guanylate cyclase domain-containing protein [Kofleriaceae bacterium]|jgi:class 3 adenylate cyclase/HAMP domain-containing protein|nr:adenylate/guanylate cyclase domain-containing protein [Kofleriaceae bacterium]
MRLRRKVTIAFFLVSALISVLLTYFLYTFIKRQLRSELETRLRDIALIGSRIVDKGAYANLAAQIGGEFDEKNSSSFEHASPDYRVLFDQLNVIRGTEPDLIRYTYLLIPTDDPNNPRYIADADAIDPDYKGEISHFNQPYDVSEIPLLKQALLDCTPQLEPDFVYDKEFDVYSVSGYFPIGGTKGHCTGVLGVDITDKNMISALDRASRLALEISLIALAIALLVSITLSTVLTRSLTALSTTVTRFANKDFAARTTIRSRDEIGQLGANFNEMAATIQEHSDNLEHLVEVRTEQLADEKQKSERLLLNVLPGPIAERLKTSDGVIVDKFEAVSVLFADIVGFTALSSRTTPEALVTMLDELFSAFDQLAEKHGLEKIKTIGDAYMVVSGIPDPRPDHAESIARMAIDMLGELHAYAKRQGTDLTIRVGINTGSVVAGVIGRKKFIYDLWGDTVNTASRMESHGVAGRIHVTQATYELLRDEFEFEARSPIEIKGKGTMQTYLLVGERCTQSSSRSFASS